MINKKARSREQRTKPGTANKLTAVRVVLTQDELTQAKQLERTLKLSKEEIFRMGLQTCASL